VILVDADLRRPSVATCTGMEGRVGLTTVLIGQAALNDVVQQWQDSTLDVLPSGRIPPNPSELLGSVAMERLLAHLTSTYDIVLLDTPPLLPVTDAAVLSNLVGGTLLVVGADRVQRPQLKQAIDALDTAGAHIHGVVVNKIDRQNAGTYVYDAGYEPLSVNDSTTPAPKRARPVRSFEGSVNGSGANGAVHEKRRRSREATPVGR
jgi:capsular exopolysaccharide synthesis family protein